MDGMSEQFFVEGRNGALVCVEAEARDGRIVITAFTERLSEAAFYRALRENWPGVEFLIYKERGYWKAEHI